MKKNLFMYVVATLVCSVLMACSDNKYPLKAVSENMIDYLESILKKPELMKDEDHFDSFYKKQEKLCRGLEGKTIDIEIEEGLGFEIVGQRGTIRRVTGESTISIPIEIKLKVADAELAYKSSLMGLVYDNQNIVYANSLRDISNNVSGDYDYEAVELDEIEFQQAFSNPYKIGDIVQKEIIISINPFLAQQFVNASKVVVTKENYDKLSTIRKKNEEIEKETRDKFKSF